MKAYLIHDGNSLELPFVPNFDITQEYNDTEFTNILGETYIIPGSLKNRTLEISGFISKYQSTYYSENSVRSLSDLLSFFESHRKSKKPCKLIVADNDTTIIEMECLASVSYSNKDGVGDIPYVIKIVESKRIDV